MVARTLPFKRDKPTDPLPSIPSEEIEKPQSVADQLKHAHEQQALEKAYPGRTPGSLLK
jgi:hypothetical protein